MQINVLESVVGGGVGRSRLIVTDENGNASKPVKINNYYSAVGIIDNIRENESTVVTQLKLLAKQGWEVTAVTSGGNQVYFTKYVLRRAK